MDKKCLAMSTQQNNEDCNRRYARALANGETVMHTEQTRTDPLTNRSKPGLFSRLQEVIGRWGQTHPHTTLPLFTVHCSLFTVHSLPSAARRARAAGGGGGGGHEQQHDVPVLEWDQLHRPRL
jgi:hypothetical protein